MLEELIFFIIMFLLLVILIAFVFNEGFWQGFRNTKFLDEMYKEQEESKEITNQ